MRSGGSILSDPHLSKGVLQEAAAPLAWGLTVTPEGGSLIT